MDMNKPEESKTDHHTVGDALMFLFKHVTDSPIWTLVWLFWLCIFIDAAFK
jgi:hypothetical protein